MNAPAFNATIFVRPALLSPILYISIIMISLMTIINPAYASGIVSSSVLYWGGGNNSGYNCTGMTSLGAVQGCELAKRQKWLADDVTQYSAWNFINIPSCPGPVLNDFGPTGSYVDHFAITYFRINYNNAWTMWCAQQLGSTDFYIFTQPSCPANSTGTTTCTCTDPYVPDPTATSCVLPACPAHASRASPSASCACDAGYKFDAAGTSCIPETFTIALSGLGGEVMPTKTLVAYAEVTTSDGLPKSGVQVTLELTVKPELDGQLPVTYTGTLSTYAGTTGADGRLNFVFTAPTAGGTHTITANCGGCTNNPVTGTIRVPGCLVSELKELPANDLCAQSLDAGLGKDVNGKCPKLDDRLPGQMQCFADKIAATNATATPSIPYAGPTATIRNTAYQGHLQDVWDKMIELNKDVNRNNEACRPQRDKVIAEKGCDSSGNCDASQCTSGSHCLAYQPATYSNHSTGTAFDVPKSTINGLLRELTQIPLAPTLQAQRIWIADWLAKPAACNLYWGGNFTDPGPDYVHFQLPY